MRSKLKASDITEIDVPNNLLKTNLFSISHLKLHLQKDINTKLEERIPLINARYEYILKGTTNELPFRIVEMFNLDGRENYVNKLNTSRIITPEFSINYKKSIIDLFIKDRNRTILIMNKYNPDAQIPIEAADQLTEDLIKTELNLDAAVIEDKLSLICNYKDFNTATNPADLIAIRLEDNTKRLSRMLDILKEGNVLYSSNNIVKMSNNFDVFIDSIFTDIDNLFNVDYLDGQSKGFINSLTFSNDIVITAPFITTSDEEFNATFEREMLSVGTFNDVGELIMVIECHNDNEKFIIISRADFEAGCCRMVDGNLMIQPLMSQVTLDVTDYIKFENQEFKKRIKFSNLPISSMLLCNTYNMNVSLKTTGETLKITNIMNTLLPLNDLDIQLNESIELSNPSNENIIATALGGIYNDNINKFGNPSNVLHYFLSSSKVKDIEASYSNLICLDYIPYFLETLSKLNDNCESLIEDELNMSENTRIVNDILSHKEQNTINYNPVNSSFLRILPNKEHPIEHRDFVYKEQIQAGSDKLSNKLITNIYRLLVVAQKQGYFTEDAEKVEFLNQLFK